MKDLISPREWDKLGYDKSLFILLNQVLFCKEIPPAKQSLNIMYKFVQNHFITKDKFLFYCVSSFYLQGVHSIIDGSPAKPWGAGEKRINKLVFIGRNLDEIALRKAFNGCLIWSKYHRGGVYKLEWNEFTSIVLMALHVII